MVKSESMQSQSLQPQSSLPESSQTTASGFRRSASGTPSLCPVSVRGSGSRGADSRTAEAGSRLFRSVRVTALCLLAALLALPSAASAQTFTLQASSFGPPAVSQGGTSASIITVGTSTLFSGTVDLTCQVTPTAGLIDPPSCLVSPATVTVPGSASATITTKGDTPTLSYAVTITGASTGQNTTTEPEDVTVLAIAPQFTVTIQRPVQPSSVPAGNGGQGTISINPINGYISPTGGVTLSCNTITPLVIYPPYCSFDKNPVQVNGTTVTSTLTVNSYGPTITTAVAPPRTFYALWMPFPMLALVGLGAAVGGKRSRKACGLLALFVVSGALFLMPACGNTTPNTTTLNGVTPDNTYTFTVIGVDANGVVSSNTGSGTNTNPSVTLTVTTPTN